MSPRSSHADDGRRILHFRMRFEESRPLAADVETVLGYAPGGAPEPVQDAIAELLASGEETWAIEGGCVLFPAIGVDLESHRLVVDGTTLDVGKVVSGQLAHAEDLAVFLCTAGAGVEALARRLMATGDPFTGFIADTVGSLVVERAMDLVQGRLEQFVSTWGERITNRYSPGYCGWGVEEQQKLFRLLPPGFCGVSLTETSLMLPVKSVSGVIGVGREARHSPYTCRLCDYEDCLYRRLQHPPEPSRVPA
jgi:hypothetical protein